MLTAVGVESDAKLVVAAINDLDNEAYWKIRPHCIDANSFISSFTSHYKKNDF
jgi:hypothetical protein